MYQLRPSFVPPSGKHRTRWALRALRLQPNSQSWGGRGRVCLTNQRQGYAMPELGRDRPVECGRVYQGLSGATNLGDGLAHSVAGLVADPHLLLRGEAGAQSLELIQDGLVGKHLDSVLSFQAQVKQQVLLHAGGVYAVTVNEEPAEGPQVRRQKEEGSGWKLRPSGNRLGPLPINTRQLLLPPHSFPKSCSAGCPSVYCHHPPNSPSQDLGMVFLDAPPSFLKLFGPIA